MKRERNKSLGFWCPVLSSNEENEYFALWDIEPALTKGDLSNLLKWELAHTEKKYWKNIQHGPYKKELLLKFGLDISELTKRQ